MFKVEHGGLLTTVQDLGRAGYQKYGLAATGALDRYAHRMANILVRNDESAATLEVTLVGLKIKLLKETVIAMTGGDLRAYINGKRAKMWTAFIVKKDDVLHFKGAKNGCRSYIAFAGGIDLPKKLGSRATDLLSGLGGFRGRALMKGDLVNTFDSPLPLTKISGRKLPPQYIPNYKSTEEIRVILGPQEDFFTRDGIDTFLSSPYKLSLDSDRMACRLVGETITHKTSADIKSEGMFTGAIQVPQNGLPIVFQAGRPSVGGYAKIAGVITVDQAKMAQLKPGDTLYFKEVTLEEAQDLYRKEEDLFSFLNCFI